MKRKALTLTIPTLLCLFLSCSEEKVPEKFYPRNDHEAYWHALTQVDLDHTALGKDWIRAAETTLSNPQKSVLPYLEALHLDPKIAEAITYRFKAKRGQKISIELSPLSADSSILFIDVFRVISDSLQEYRHIATADSSFKLAFEARKNNHYLLRIQPELLRGGNYRLSVDVGPSFKFPVAGKNKRAIQSFFGDPRDGGRREHHGVDIFARRHTPILAPCDGYIRFVGVRGLGGKVIWLQDSKHYDNLYFAHLDSQWVKARTFVKTGDTLGTVGNTGNARFTPPHLHFGIYNNGPMDPYYFIADTKRKVVEPGPTEGILGQMKKSTNTQIITREAQGKSPLDTLTKDEHLRITAIVGNTLRVKTLAGKTGYLPRKALVSLQDVLDD